MRRALGTFLLAVALTAAPLLGVAVSDLEIVTLIAEGDVPGARALFRLTEPEQIDWLFFDGRVAKAQGRFNDAIATFREVLRLDPAYLDARRELAHSLFLAEEYRASTHHFQDLLRSDPSADQREGYLFFLNEIDRIRPFSINGTLAFISSNNVNRGSSQDTFNPGVPDLPAFEITSQAEAGTGIELGIAGRNIWQGSEGYYGRLDWGIARRSFDVASHSSVPVSAQLQFGRSTGRTRWSVGPTLRGFWSARGDHWADAGLQCSLDRRIAPRTIVSFSANAGYRDVMPSSNLDGPVTALQVGAVRLISNGSILMGGRVALSRPDQKHSRFDAQTVFAHTAYAWPGGFEAGLRLDVGRRAYLADFPLAGEAREDTFYQATVSAQHDAVRLGRFSPSVFCTFGTARSNVAFYDHDVRECTVGIATRF